MDSVNPLIECGLLTVDNGVATDFKASNILSIQNKEIVCCIIADESKENFISIEPYVLTTSGKELYNIIKNTSEYKPNIEYPLLCFRELKDMYPNLLFSAHSIVGEDEFDPHNIL